MSFPYKIFNDMSAKLKAAEAYVDEVRKHYDAKIAGLIEEYEEKLAHVRYQAPQVCIQTQQTEPLEDKFGKEKCEEAVDDEIHHLKNKVSQLVYENNRYHLMLSNCTMCSDISMMGYPAFSMLPPLSLSIRKAQSR